MRRNPWEYDEPDEPLPGERDPEDSYWDDPDPDLDDGDDMWPDDDWDDDLLDETYPD
jgi:hypothetical protein